LLRQANFTWTLDGDLLTLLVWDNGADLPGLVNANLLGVGGADFTWNGGTLLGREWMTFLLLVDATVLLGEILAVFLVDANLTWNVTANLLLKIIALLPWDGDASLPWFVVADLMWDVDAVLLGNLFANLSVLDLFDSDDGGGVGLGLLSLLLLQFPELLVQLIIDFGNDSLLLVGRFGQLVLQFNNLAADLVLDGPLVLLTAELAAKLGQRQLLFVDDSRSRFPAHRLKRDWNLTTDLLKTSFTLPGVFSAADAFVGDGALLVLQSAANLPGLKATFAFLMSSAFRTD